MTHCMKLNAEPFEEIERGEKDRLRLYDKSAGLSELEM